MASAHAHHLWPRSFLRSQPYEWIELSDGTVIGNRIGLCVRHHGEVTGDVGGHRGRIRFHQGLFWWEEPIHGSWHPHGPLSSQPPGAKRLEASVPAASGSNAPVAACPTCGHVRNRPKHTARKSKTWTLCVPDDSEIGSDILDGWVDDIAAILGLEDTTSRLRRYHALAVGLAWIIQNRSEFARDIAVASEKVKA